MTDEPRPFDGVVVDIEGTTTPVSFVYDILLPYARARLRAFLSTHEESLIDATTLLRDEWQTDVARGEAVQSLVSDSNGKAEVWLRYLEWLMDRDRKSPGLKLIQGRIWDGGFTNGTLRGDVYPDVAPAFARWKEAGARVAIYSSGSVLAQRQLFTHSTAGDLSGFIDSYFDTGVGPKRDASSYFRIAAALGLRPERILFISDVSAELNAARETGMSTRLCARGDGDPSATGGHEIIANFGMIGF